MDHFHIQEGELYCDGIAARELARLYGTPLYTYCGETVRHHLRALQSAFEQLDPLICYSVKANSNLQLLDLMRQQGAGFDVVSGGELQRVLEIGGDPKKVVYAGVGKTRREIREAIAADILLFNVESESELYRIDECAREANTSVGIALRLNPDVDPKTHRYITTGKRENKFGVDLSRARAVLQKAATLPGVSCRGVHVHLGSQITDTAPYREGIEKVLEFLESGVAGSEEVEWLDIGGGFGIHYHDSEALPATAFAEVIVPLMAGRGLRLILEPGRFIMGNAGVLLTEVVTVKRSGERNFVICDAGMNDLVRPSLYDSFHRIAPVKPRSGSPALTDVVGPICESGDFLGLDRELPPIHEGDLLAVFSAGAYGFAMAGNYNTRRRAAEVLVERGAGKESDGGCSHRLIRRRETYDDLVATERDLGGALHGDLRSGKHGEVE